MFLWNICIFNTFIWFNQITQLSFATIRCRHASCTQFQFDYFFNPNNHHSNTTVGQKITKYVRCIQFKFNQHIICLYMCGENYGHKAQFHSDLTGCQNKVKFWRIFAVTSIDLNNSQYCLTRQCAELDLLISVSLHHVYQLQYENFMVQKCVLPHHTSLNN